MAERSNTGGNKEFSYSKEDSERIREEDTPSTEDFKKAYDGWHEERKETRAMRKELYGKLKMGIGFAVALIVLLLIFYFL